HGQGRGYLGFGKLTTIDSRDDDYDMVTETVYHQGFDEDETGVKTYLKYPELVGMPLMTTQKMVKRDTPSSEITLSRSVNSYTKLITKANTDSSVKRSPYFTYINTSEEKSYFLNGGITGLDYSAGGLKAKTTTTQSYDTDGNLTESQIVLKDNVGTTFTTETINEYVKTPSRCNMSGLKQDYGGNYGRFGRLTCSEVTKTNSEGKTGTRQSAFAYNKKGLLYQEKVNAQSEAQSVITEYGFNSAGLKISTTVSGKELKAGSSYSTAPTLSGETLVRTTKVKYDSTNRFIISQTNDAGHLVCFNVDKDTGWLKSKTVRVAPSAPNVEYSCPEQEEAEGLITRYRYDAFGQLTGEQSPAGIVKLISRGTNPSYPYGFVEQTRVSGAQPSKTYYDRAGRAIKQINTGYNNQQSVVKTEYDQYGRAYR
ncbi:hypothetical protein HG263_22130, partial [Pseudoalteromonas sp. JBTF-M23]